MRTRGEAYGASAHSRPRVSWRRRGRVALCSIRTIELQACFGRKARHAARFLRGTRRCTMATASTTAWVLHDLGLAAGFGGTLFGKMALNPAVKEVRSREERGKVLDRAWRGF